MSEFTNEEGRLSALQAYKLDRSVPNESLHDFVEQVSLLFDVPIASVSLVEDNQQVTFVASGLDHCAYDRNQTFCDRTIAIDQTMVVLDAQFDPRWADNIYVIGSPNVRFYAGAPLRSPKGHPIGALCIADQRPHNRFTDTERKRLEVFAQIVVELFDLNRLRLERHSSETRFEQMTNTSPDGMCIADGQGRIVSWNAGASRIWGYTTEEMKNFEVSDLLPERLRYNAGKFATMFDPGLGRTQEIPILTKAGVVKIVEFSLSRWSEAEQTFYGAVVRDISDRKMTEAALHRLAHHDGLTELPNRTVLCARLRDALAGGGHASVLMIDLDGFKDVNDSYGHGTGDNVLRITAQRLLNCTATVDTVARLGGDEFVVMLPHCADPLRATAVADRIIQSLGEPYLLDDKTVSVGASVGLAFAPHHASEPDALLSCADLALYQAKKDGRHRYRLYERHLGETLADRQRFYHDLSRAIHDGEFTLFYQPQFRLSDRTLVGAEALIRWQHPTSGLLQPGAFIEMLNASRFAALVGNWVIETACRQAAAWRALGFPDFRMGVNACEAQFTSGPIEHTVFAALQAAGLPARNLEVEITEDIVSAKDDRNVRSLQNLKDAGVDIAFDDYGTGYASLSLLERFPLTRLKIDRSFVRESTSKSDWTIVRAILYLANGFGLNVIAEGIENVEQFALLEREGCNEGQGFYLGRPVPPEEFERQFIVQYADCSLSPVSQSNLYLEDIRKTA